MANHEQVNSPISPYCEKFLQSSFFCLGSGNNGCSSRLKMDYKFL